MVADIQHFFTSNEGAIGRLRPIWSADGDNL